MSSEPDMSDAQFTNLFSILIGGLILLTIALIILAVFVSSGVNQSNLNDLARDSQTAQRIAPEGRIVVGDAGSTQPSSQEAGDAGAADAASGESVYQSSCAACHASGVAGAPVFGDTSAWTERVAQGMDTLYQHSIEGFQGDAGVMPPKGGNTSLSDEAVRAAVDHMVDAVSETEATETEATETEATETEATETEATETEAAESEAAESEAAESEAAESEAAESEAAESEAAESEAAESEAAESEAAESEAAETDEPGSGDTAAGEAVYQSSCTACHASGVAGAPRLGHTEAWSDRIAQGMETLYTNSIEGFQGDTGMMPPKGGNMSLSDDEVKAAVDYMVQQSE